MSPELSKVSFFCYWLKISNYGVILKFMKILQQIFPFRFYFSLTDTYSMRYLSAALFLCVFSIFSPALPAQAAKVYVDITSPFMRKIPVAVPPPQVRGGTFEDSVTARNISRVLSSDLEFMGFFSIPDPALYSTPGMAIKDYPSDYVVKSVMTHTGSSLVMEFRLIETATGKLTAGVKYRGTMADQRVMAHRFADRIVRAITGEGGLTLSRIAFVGSKGKSREIYSADFDGHNVRKETSQRTIVLSPRYSPDARFLAFTSYRAGRPCLYIKDLKSGSVFRSACFKGSNIAHAWHPDSRSLAVTLSRDGSPDIYLIDIRGKIKKRLTWGRSINISPSWSPDGKYLVFISDRSGSPQLYILNTGSGSVRRLTFSGSYNTDPQWSPRGDKIVYCSRLNGKFQIFTISAGGGEPEQLTFNGSNENPSWSPDGRQILFSSTRDGKGKSLYVMYLNGSAQRRLLSFGSSASMPFWGPNRFMN